MLYISCVIVLLRSCVLVRQLSFSTDPGVFSPSLSSSPCPGRVIKCSALARTHTSPYRGRREYYLGLDLSYEHLECNIRCLVTSAGSWALQGLHACLQYVVQQ